MLDEITLEQRFVTLEQAVSDLQRKLESQPTSETLLQKLTDSISDEAAFLESLKHGRTFRQAEQTIDQVGEQV